MRAGLAVRLFFAVATLGPPANPFAREAWAHDFSAFALSRGSIVTPRARVGGRHAPTEGDWPDLTNLVTPLATASHWER
jgi:hypothetical protein